MKTSRTQNTEATHVLSFAILYRSLPQHRNTGQDKSGAIPAVRWASECSTMHCKHRAMMPGTCRHSVMSLYLSLRRRSKHTCHRHATMHHVPKTPIVWLDKPGHDRVTRPYVTRQTGCGGRSYRVNVGQVWLNLAPDGSGASCHRVQHTHYRQPRHHNTIPNDVDEHDTSHLPHHATRTLVNTNSTRRADLKRTARLLLKHHTLDSLTGMDALPRFRRRHQLIIWVTHLGVVDAPHHDNRFAVWRQKQRRRKGMCGVALIIWRSDAATITECTFYQAGGGAMTSVLYFATLTQCRCRS